MKQGKKIKRKYILHCATLLGLNKVIKSFFRLSSTKNIDILWLFVFSLISVKCQTMPFVEYMKVGAKYCISYKNMGLWVVYDQSVLKS